MKKLIIEEKNKILLEAKNIAKQNNGKCLSEEYINFTKKLKFQCDKGHIFEKQFICLKKGQWCPCCKGWHKTIDDMQKIAESKGGKCLSKKYIHSEVKLKWKCKKGHIWEACPHDIIRNHWCPYCSHSIKLTIDEMKNFAIKKGGKCLSNKYFDSFTKLIWQCDKGHIWKATPNNIRRGQWCPFCAGNVKLTIKEMQKFALKQGGWCLSSEYINNHTNLWWQCGEGHIWNARPQNIKNKEWCPYCCGNRKLSIEEMKKQAKKRGGRCLSTLYVNAKSKLIWKCNNDHIWESAYDSIKQGAWCPICSSSSNENICRAYFEIIFNKKFLPNRPEWLINSRGYRMQLDGYNEELGISFEYNGEQHYICQKDIRRDYFEYRKQNDKLKKEICKKHNVKLIVIPYAIKFENMQNYIVEECIKNGIKLKL